MGFEAPKYEKKQRPIPNPGLQIAVCYSIIDLGTHNMVYQNQAPKPTPLIHFSWEFVNLPHQIFDEQKGPQPMAIFQEYSTSLGDKAKLPKMLASWRNGIVPTNLTVELPQFLGQPCMINVEHNKDKNNPNITYANIGLKGLGVMPIMQGTQVNPLTNKKILFNLDHYSHEVFLQLPGWIQKKIMDSLEWPGIVARFGQPPQQQGHQNNTGFQQQGTQQGYQQSQNNGFNQQPNQNFNQQQSFQQGFNQNPQSNQPAQNINQHQNHLC